MNTASKKRLQFLDLPIDILREIISQLPHTNDLTSLALCHSALHSLCIPCIYARFDIVWPDASVDTTARAGVDALTYGLSTLVTGEETFGDITWRRLLEEEHLALTGQTSVVPSPPLQRRHFGNDYAKYTKKFSLGNGPPEWVQEYLITKEGGKMLGTLVALAVARMRNLESFIWDMPTGVIRDIWLALSALGRDDLSNCRLEKVWIRLHNNTQNDSSDQSPPPPPPLIILPLPPITQATIAQAANTQTTIPQTISSAATSMSPSTPLMLMGTTPMIDRARFPTFSILPPLKSISVTDIDELSYLDELSILLARSRGMLRELRIGIAEHAFGKEWTCVWDGEEVRQIDWTTPWTSVSKIGNKRLGGVLGTLVGRIHNLRNNRSQDEVEREKATATHQPQREVLSEQDVTRPRNSGVKDSNPLTTASRGSNDDDDDDDGQDETASTIVGDLGSLSNIDNNHPEPSHFVKVPIRSSGLTITQDINKIGPRLCGKLQLDTLELERVCLSINVALSAFDWHRLTNLTLLNCPDHEMLWRAFRRKYSPSSESKANPGEKSRRDYPLRLKKIHTNTVSPSLIQLLQYTLAKNSLEVLFLQETQMYTSTVSIDAICKGPLRRHRASLKNLLIDSSGGDGDFGVATRWRRWLLKREHLAFITSGEMGNLRELAISIDYSDWHDFLQHLPSIKHVRSLYIPHIADHPHGTNIDLRDLALQVVDIVTLRPEVELCYIGIAAKCFEILEANYCADKNGASSSGGNDDGFEATTGGPAEQSATIYHDDSGAAAAFFHNGVLYTTPQNLPHVQNLPYGQYALPPLPPSGQTLGDEDDDGSLSYDLADDGLDDDQALLESESELSDMESESDDESWKASQAVRQELEPRLRLREILFYDDKISIFRARHGRL